MEKLLTTLDDFIEETRRYRSENDGVLQEHGAQIRCLATEFKKYEPQLQAALKSRKWWGDFWDKRQEELLAMGVKAGVVMLVGLVFFAISEKAISWIKSIKATIT